MTNIEYMMRIFNDDRLEGICFKHAAHDEDDDCTHLFVCTFASSICSVSYLYLHF